VKVCVIGLGYVGLPLSVLLAEIGCEIIGVDTNKELIAKINSGVCMIHETELEERLKMVIALNKLKVQESPENADIFVFSVQTPLLNGKPNLDYLNKAFNSVKPFIKKDNLLIIESTCPVGTSRFLYDKYLDNNSDYQLAYCPERILPGDIMNELVINDRVIGGIDEVSTNKAIDFYKLFCKGMLLETTAETAEFVKLIENTYRDVNIAFANELEKIAKEKNINCFEAISLANKHPRVNIHYPGIGVGGHCIPKDPVLLTYDSDSAKLIKTARKINKNKPKEIVSRINEFYKMNIGSFEKSRIDIGILGLAYKPNTNDFRESPAIEIMNQLQNMQCFNIKFHDPFITDCNSIEEIKKCDIVVLLVGHKDYLSINKELKDTKGVNFINFAGDK